MRKCYLKMLFNGVPIDQKLLFSTVLGTLFSPPQLTLTISYISEIAVLWFYYNSATGVAPVLGNLLRSLSLFLINS